MIRFVDQQESSAKILVIGIGSAAGMVIDRVARLERDNLETAIIDSDREVLKGTHCHEKLHVSRDSLVGGQLALAEAGSRSQKLVEEIGQFVGSLPRADIVFAVSGLGGLTGTAIGAYTLRELKKNKQWVWALLTIPFFFEGKQKIINSLQTVKQLQNFSDALMIIPHDKIFNMVDKNISMREAFIPANKICTGLISSIHFLIDSRNWISINSADIKGAIIDQKITVYGTGQGKGGERVIQAAQQALASPLLSREIMNSCRKLLVSIQGGEDLTVNEIDACITFLSQHLSRQVNISFGAASVKGMENKAAVGLIALGLDSAFQGDPSRNWDLSLPAKEEQKPQLRPQAKPQVPVQVQPQTKMASKLKSRGKPRQTMLDFNNAAKGRFERSSPTIHHGEDLDIPAFLRRKKP